MDHGQLVDSMIGDGLWCAFDAVHMGAGTERYTGEMGGITREMQDEFAAQSHERAAAAIKDGRLAEEIEPVEIPQRTRRSRARRHRRRRTPRHHRGVPRQAATRVRARRHDHRGERVADLRRRCRDWSS